MKKIIIFLSIFVLYFSTCFAQSISTLPQDVNSLIKQGKAFIYINTNSVFEVIQEMISLMPGSFRLLAKTFPELSNEIKMDNLYFSPNKINYFIGILEKDSFIVEIKCSDSGLAKELVTFLEKFKKLYCNYLQKSIDIYSREKLENSTFADLTIISTALYSHLNAKKFIDSIEISLGEKESAVFLKTKYDYTCTIRSAALSCFSAMLDTEGTEKYIDYISLKDKNNNSRCLLNQTFVSLAIDDYNHDNEDKMLTTLDIPFLLKTKYLRQDQLPDENCEYYTEGDLTQGGYIACKIHGSNKRPLYYSNKKSRH